MANKLSYGKSSKIVKSAIRIHTSESFLPTSRLGDVLTSKRDRNLFQKEVLELVASHGFRIEVENIVIKPDFTIDAFTRELSSLPGKPGKPDEARSPLSGDSGTLDEELYGKMSEIVNSAIRIHTNESFLPSSPLRDVLISKGDRNLFQKEVCEFVASHGFMIDLENIVIKPDFTIAAFTRELSSLPGKPGKPDEAFSPLGGKPGKRDED